MCIRDRYDDGIFEMMAVLRYIATEFFQQRGIGLKQGIFFPAIEPVGYFKCFEPGAPLHHTFQHIGQTKLGIPCLLYTSDAADERSSVDLGGRRIIKKKTDKKKAG